jgi:hypothetical protein
VLDHTFFLFVLHKSEAAQAICISLRIYSFNTVCPVQKISDEIVRFFSEALWIRRGRTSDIAKNFKPHPYLSTVCAAKKILDDKA